MTNGEWHLNDNVMDPAVETLFMAFEKVPELTVEGPVAFLHAQPHGGLGRFSGRLTCEQTWKPAAEALTAAGLESTSDLLLGDGEYALVLLRPQRQRDQAHFDIARAFRLLQDGGTLVVSLPNDWGAARYEKQVAELAGSVESLSKHHCRVFWTQKTEALDRTLLKEWFEGGQPRPVEDAPEFQTRPGLFSWEKVDRGSRFLTNRLPATLSGRVADVGAGWGWISHWVLGHCPNVKEIHLYEADALALEAAERNLRRFKRPDGPQIHLHWHDVTRGLGGETFDAVVMNPPFHSGRQADPLLGHKFIAAGLQAMRPGASLWLVANQFLPYERFLKDALPDASIAAQEAGFKVLTGHRARPERQDTGEADGFLPRPRKGKHKKTHSSRGRR